MSAARSFAFGAGAASAIAGAYSASLISYGPAFMAVIAVFFIAALLFICAGLWLPASSRRGSLVAAGGALVLAGWAVTTGYGAAGIVSRPAAVLGLIAALTCLGLLRSRARVLMLTVLIVASSLLALIAAAPFALPFTLLWVYAVMAAGPALVAVALLPESAQRSAPVVALTAVVGWAVGAGVCILAFGLPLSNS